MTGKSLAEIFGTQFKSGAIVSTIDGPALEGRFNVSGTPGEWSAAPVLTLNVVMSDQKADPGVTGGGGKSYSLGLDKNVSFEVRLKQAMDLTGYQVRFVVLPAAQEQMMPPGFGGNDPTGPREGDDQKTVPGGPRMEPPKPKNCTELNPAGGKKVEMPGTYSTTLLSPTLIAVHADIYQGDARVAIFCTRLLAVFNVHWTITNSIPPLGAAAAGAATPNFDKMRDAYKVPLGTTNYMGVTNKTYWPSIRADTKYNGAWGPGKGTHIDLGYSMGTSKGCAFSNALPGPKPEDFAAHLLTLPPAGTDPVSIEVGAVGACGSSRPTAYPNAGPVPYAVNIHVDFTEAAMPPMFPSPPGPR